MLRLPLLGWWEHGAFSFLLQSGVSCANTCLVGVRFHFEHGLHRWNTLKMLFDLMWLFSNFPLCRRKKLQVPKSERTRYCTQKNPLLLKSSGLFFL